MEWSRPLHHLLLPVQVSADMSGTFAIKMFGIVPDVFVVGSPLVQVTKQQVMFSAPGLTQGDQIVRVKLEMRVQVEGLDMMNLQVPTFVATGHARRLAEPMLLFHAGPLGAALLSQPPGCFGSRVGWQMA